MSYSEEDIQAVWEKGRVVQTQNSDLYRIDDCGAWIARNQYGNRDSTLGWEIDHIDPNGPTQLRNLRPLQWENNASKQDGPDTCPITASGLSNIRRVQT